jgi:hypothetical protein
MAAVPASPALVACSAGSNAPGGAGAGTSGMPDGGSQTNADATATPGADATSEASSASDGDSVSDSGSSLNPDSGLNSGDIILSATVPNGASVVPLLSVAAGFIADHKVASFENVLLTLDAGPGSCTVGALSFQPPPASGTQVSAGTITVTGGSASIALAPMAVSSGDGGAAEQYAPLQHAGTVSSGQTLTIAASGATVPAFSTNLVVPDAVTFTQPDIVDASSLAIGRSTDWPIAWTGGSAGTLTFQVSQTLGATGTLIVCTFPESAGSGVIPAAALGYLTPSSALDGGSPQSTSVGVSTFASQSVTAGDWTVAVDIAISLAVGIGTVVTVE